MDGVVSGFKAEKRCVSTLHVCKLKHCCSRCALYQAAQQFLIRSLGCHDASVVEGQTSKAISRNLLVIVQRTQCPADDRHDLDVWIGPSRLIMQALAYNAEPVYAF